MKSQKNPVVILSIDQTLFSTDLFKERLTYTNLLDESEYIELLYLTEKRIFQELTIKRNIPINIFSARKELLVGNYSFNDTAATKQLRDYLEDYKNYQIYFIGDQLTQLIEAKIFNNDITTILLQMKDVKEKASKSKRGIDKIIHKLKEIIPIILDN